MRQDVAVTLGEIDNCLVALSDYANNKQHGAIISHYISTLVDALKSLKDICVAQEHEISSLKDELRRMRAFPYRSILH